MFFLVNLLHFLLFVFVFTLNLTIKEMRCSSDPIRVLPDATSDLCDLGRETHHRPLMMKIGGQINMSSPTVPNMKMLDITSP